MSNGIIIALIVVGIFLAFKFYTKAGDNVKTVTVTELKQAKKNKEKFILVDVREDSERAVNKIEGSSHLKLGDVKKGFEKKFAKTKKDDKIILYCRSGRRSETAALILQDLGYSNVFSLQGGILDYLDNE